MRASGDTYFGLALSVVVFTNSMIAFFAGPSFHDGKGSAAFALQGNAKSTLKTRINQGVMYFLFIRVSFLVVLTKASQNATKR